jgi:hypothetical protein
VLTTLLLLLLLQVGLLGPDGRDLPLHLEGKGAVGSSTVLRCDAEHNSFTFTDVTVRAQRCLRAVWLYDSALYATAAGVCIGSMCCSSLCAANVLLEGYPALDGFARDWI